MIFGLASEPEKLFRNHAMWWFVYFEKKMFCFQLFILYSIDFIKISLDSNLRLLFLFYEQPFGTHYFSFVNFTQIS